MPSRLIQLVVVPVLFLVGVKLSLVLAVLPDVVVMLWLPNGLLLATLLHYGLHRYLYFAALIIVVEIAADWPTFSIFEAALFGVINLFEVTSAYLLLRRWRFNPRFSAPIDIAKFLAAGPVIGNGLPGAPRLTGGSASTSRPAGCAVLPIAIDQASPNPAGACS